ncbi:hypothetical protein F4805DRAFT_457042 [Annulohypoxylon moriforme]|nr:hypothetical protein F4805DRAFT_457042 [Annulohypoxylon moriforme]
MPDEEYIEPTGDESQLSELPVVAPQIPELPVIESQLSELRDIDPRLFEPVVVDPRPLEPPVDDPSASEPPVNDPQPTNPINDTSSASKQRSFLAMSTSYRAPTFEGKPGDDPNDFLEDIEIETTQRSGPDADDALKEKIRKSLFRNALKGEPKNWYRNLPKDKKDKWEELTKQLIERFPWRASSSKYKFSAKVEEFERNAGEPLTRYIYRATKLNGKGGDEEQQKILKRRFLSKMCANGHSEDEHTQARVFDRLHASKKLDEINKPTTDCTFNDIRSAMIQCGAKPGKEGEFMDAVEGDDSDDDSQKKWTNVENIDIDELVKKRVAKELKAREGLTSPPPAYPQPATYPFPVDEKPVMPNTRMMQNMDRTSGYRGGDARRSSFSTRPGQGSSNQQPYRATRPPFVCYNCGIEGHSSWDCTKVLRPLEERQRIRYAVDNGQALPSDLRYDLPDKNPNAKDDKTKVPVNTGQVLYKKTGLPVMSIENRVTEITSGDESQQPSGTQSTTMAAEKRKADKQHVSADDAANMEIDDEDDPMADVQEKRRMASMKDKGKRRADSPHPRKAVAKGVKGKEVPTRDQLNQILRESKNKLMQRKRGPLEPARPREKQDTIPIRAYEGRQKDRIDIAAFLRQSPFPHITWGQFLDRSPTMRAQLAKALGVSTRRRSKLSVMKPDKHGRYEPHSATLRSMMANLNYIDRAESDDGQTYMGYIGGEVLGDEVRRCMVDCGSLSELISPSCARKLNLKLLKLEEECELKMADDSTTPIYHYVMFPLVVGGILTIIRAYVVGMNESYDVLLGKGWLRRNKATVNFATEHLSLTGINGETCVLKMAAAPSHGPIAIEKKGKTNYRPPMVESDFEDDTTEETDVDSDIDDEEEREDIYKEFVDIAELAMVMYGDEDDSPKN